MLENEADGNSIKCLINNRFEDYTNNSDTPTPIALKSLKSCY